ncbi:hypothetical protein SCHPADRAFT_944978 [Schizopora paradoxa]|uniref:Spindle assembly checkpoint component MAD1 n=1 Tax=Schizopora paradoxa TaxID=27342 RepID=A0A0H2R8T8_9AGAM|nr:hypothetical protein SCHPADRAFT_944978 [Schizopora paradoxa]
MQAGPSTNIRRSTRSGTSTNPPSSSRAALGLAGSTAAGSGTTTLKRKTRSTSVGIDEELTTSKKPALSSTFTAHITASTLQKKLLDAQSQVTALQNDLQTRKADIDRLEADRRLLATQVDEQTKGREKATSELAKLRGSHAAALSSLQSRFRDLEAAHDDLTEAHDIAQHTNDRLQTRISSIEAELSLTERERDDLRAENDRLRNQLHSGVQTDTGVKDEHIIQESGPPSIASWQSESSVSTTGSEEDGVEELEGEFHDEEVDDADTFREEDVYEEDAEGEVEDDEEDMSLTRPMVTIIRSSQAPSSPPRPAQDDYDISSSRPSSSSPAPIRSPAAITRVGPPIGAKKSKRRSNSKSGGPSSLAERLSAPRSSPSQPARSSPPSLTPTRRLSTPLRGTVLSPRNENPSNDHDRAVIRAELTKLMSHLRSLEASNARLTSEAARLRPRAEGAEVLREKVRDLERKVDGVEALRTRVAELEKQLEEANTALTREQESRRNEQLANNQMDVDVNADARPPVLPAATPGTPISVTTQLSALRTAHARLLDEHGQVVATLKARDTELSELQSEIDQSRLDILKLKTETAAAASEKKSVERSCSSKDREIEFLKSLISSYKAEEAYDRSFAPEDVQAREAEMDGRLVQMEAVIDEYKSTVAKLEEELEISRSGSSGLRHGIGTTSAQIQELVSRAKDVQARNEELEKAAQVLRDENEKLAARIDSLEQQLFELGGEMGGGRHIPPGMRVVCLRDNPARLWADTREQVLNRLRSENEALLKRLEEVESRLGNGDVNMVPTSGSNEGQGATLKIVPIQTWESLKQEKSDLEDALKQREKRLQRLKDIFQLKGEEFREAIAAIMGLKLAFYPNGQIRVTSMYDLSASFVFQPEKGSKGKDATEVRMQLIGQGEGGPQELEQLMNYWVQQEMSIPCFLASVTLECYDKIRREREAGGVN